MSCYLFSWVKERGDRGSPKRFRTQRHHEHTSETGIAASEHETDSNCNKRFYLVWWTLLSGIIWWKGSIHRVWGKPRWSAHLGLAALPPFGTRRQPRDALSRRRALGYVHPGQQEMERGEFVEFVEPRCPKFTDLHLPIRDTYSCTLTLYLTITTSTHSPTFPIHLNRILPR